ncbi:phytanoyl-CoA dioxygenase family protein [Georgenia yuyongxinii]|uniref:Phytanoyl-CoA dioxygenase family protein n=1 Tax=Georgenia yuyongxinii TaxID=2589797 RepID=A0A552WQ87_9MICO|nr:phytanoyl-CoA dioxygenase family protein [Georgenia yuyongxinii]TRW44920.1 phytanoyl-CoA dioxygenase family protein [Georgenia yuyongxinii]
MEPDLDTHGEPRHDPLELSDALHRDGMAVVPGAFTRDWASVLDDDLSAEFMTALRSPDGVAPRGWNRFYFEPYAERVRGFLDLVQHPVLAALSAEMFGPEWQVVELGCDIPLPGALDQPWHRDFPMPEYTRSHRRLTSIAVNVPSMDVVDAPFQAVLGTHLDDDANFDGGMFPPAAREHELETRMKSFYGRMGNLSVRSGLMLHRGSAMGLHSRMRPVAILGIVSPGDGAVSDGPRSGADRVPPRVRMSREYHDRLPAGLRRHVVVEIVAGTTATLPPHRTDHTFEGLRMGGPHS